MRFDSPHTIDEIEQQEHSMQRRQAKAMERISRQYLSHIPIPYGCLTILALSVAALTLLVVSSYAIGVAILK
jgi:hypothetical protein